MPYVMQGNAVMQLRCEDIFNDDFITDLMLIIIQLDAERILKIDQQLPYSLANF